jgi:protein-S-isoprenylcysteine O-methyltransferase Ste14
MWQFSREEMDKPITWGLYQVSRNPMQVMGFVLSLGVAIIANNLVLWILTIVNIVTSYPMFFMQEKYCIERYGEVYMRYMQRTPRVLFINKRMKKS